MATQAERRARTRGAILAAARAEMGRRGYADTSLAAILETAGVTKGALYHHFRDKQDVFRSVYDDLEAETSARLSEQLAGIDDPMLLLRTGGRIFLEACLDPETRQLMLVDAPAVLGWQEWREIDARHGLGLITTAVFLAVEMGLMRPLPVDQVAHLLLAALMEAALLLAAAADPAAAVDDLVATLDAVIDGLAP